MVIGILQFDVLIHGSESLKDKRRVVKSLKDRLHREHMVSVAEVGSHDKLNIARLALVCVANDGSRVGEVLDAITNKLHGLHDAELGGMSRQIIHGSQIPEETPDETLAREEAEAQSRAALSREMLEYFNSSDRPDEDEEDSTL
jgi:uncharacterized protein